MLTSLKIFENQWGQVSDNVYDLVQRNGRLEDFRPFVDKWQSGFTFRPGETKEQIFQQFWDDYHTARERFLEGFHAVWILGE